MEEEEKKEVEAWEEEFPHNKPRASLFLCVGVGPTLPRAAHRDCSVCAIHCLEWFGFRSFSPLPHFPHPLPSPSPFFTGLECLFGRCSGGYYEIFSARRRSDAKRNIEAFTPHKTELSNPTPSQPSRAPRPPRTRRRDIIIG